MKTKTTLFAKFLIAIFAVALISGCNTVQGIGKDLGAAGEKIEDSAKKNKKY